MTVYYLPSAVRAEQQHERARARLLSPRVPAGADELERLARLADWRQALDLAEGAVRRGQLRRVLDRAIDGGDQNLARACAVVALEDRDRAVVNAYLERFPTHRRMLERAECAVPRGVDREDDELIFLRGEPS